MKRKPNTSQENEMISKNKLVEQLGKSLKSIDYAVSLIPRERFLLPPPHGKHPNADKGFKSYFGEWSAARQLFHIIFYEQNYAVPAMEYWLGEPHPKSDLLFPDSGMEEVFWQNTVPDELTALSLIQKLRSVRSEEILIAEAISEADFMEERLETRLGKLSFVTVVMRTIQHTFEHGSDLLKNALLWDNALEWLGKQG